MEKSYNMLTSELVCDFLNNHVSQNTFHNEDKERYSKLICKCCFDYLSHAKNKEKNHVLKERKLPKARKTDFLVFIALAVVDDDKWNHTDEHCKI